jgi:hypothetical protein
MLHFHPSLIFANKAEAYPAELNSEGLLHSRSQILDYDVSAAYYVALPSQSNIFEQG